jgi:hypothetical protein
VARGGDGRQRAAGALGVEADRAEPGGADQQGHAEDAVDRDHHRGEHRLARQGCRLVTTREHQGDDERDLDDGDGHGEHE